MAFRRAEGGFRAVSAWRAAKQPGIPLKNAIFYNCVIFKEKCNVCVHDEQYEQDKFCIFADLIG